MTRKPKIGMLCVLVIGQLFAACAGSSGSTREDGRRQAWRLAVKAAVDVKRGRFDAAIRTSRKALGLDSSCSMAYAALGRAFNAQHLYDSTYRVLNQGLAAGADSAVVYVELGIAADEQTRTNEAAEYLERAIGQDSMNAEALFRLARLYYRRGELEACFPLAERAAALNSRDDRVAIFFQKVLADYKLEFPRLSFEARRLVSIQNLSNLTRADLGFLWITIVHPKSKASPIQFKDMNDSDSLTIYCREAVLSGFLEILPDMKFHPGYALRRRNLAHYLYEYGRSQGLENSGTPTTLPKDVAVDDPQAKAILWAIASGLMENKGLEFRPDDGVSGPEATAVLRVFHTKLDRKAKADHVR